jgi:hypothetical protein
LRSVTILKHGTANAVIVDSYTVGSAYIVGTAGTAITRTITSYGGHVTLTPISTPSGLWWMTLSESL